MYSIMDAEQSKPSTSIISSSSRTSSFSVEALISKPGQKSTNVIKDSTSGLQSDFSVERLLNKHTSKEEEVESKVEATSPERRDSKETDETTSDFPWMHSTRYDPPPRKSNLLFSAPFSICQETSQM